MDFQESKVEGRKLIESLFEPYHIDQHVMDTPWAGMGSNSLSLGWCVECPWDGSVKGGTVRLTIVCYVQLCLLISCASKSHLSWSQFLIETGTLFFSSLVFFFIPGGEILLFKELITGEAWPLLLTGEWRWGYTVGHPMSSVWCEWQWHDTSHGYSWMHQIIE